MTMFVKRAMKFRTMFEVHVLADCQSGDTERIHCVGGKPRAPTSSSMKSTRSGTARVTDGAKRHL
jgi:hypothetical protein